MSFDCAAVLINRVALPDRVTRGEGRPGETERPRYRVVMALGVGLKSAVAADDKAQDWGLHATDTKNALKPPRLRREGIGAGHVHAIEQIAHAARLGRRG